MFVPLYFKKTQSSECNRTDYATDDAARNFCVKTVSNFSPKCHIILKTYSYDSKLGISTKKKEPEHFQVYTAATQVGRVNHTGSVQVFQQQCISKTTLKVLLFSQTVRSNGRSCCFLMTAICAGRETLVKKQALWLTKRPPVPPHIHTNKHMHTLMSQMRKKY